MLGCCDWVSARALYAIETDDNINDDTVNTAIRRNAPLASLDVLLSVILFTVQRLIGIIKIIDHY
jgi:hypothetical protein